MKKEDIFAVYYFLSFKKHW